MRKAYKYALSFSNMEEKEIIKASLAHLEQEIECADDDVPKEALLLPFLLATYKKRGKLKLRLKV